MEKLCVKKQIKYSVSKISTGELSKSKNWFVHFWKETFWTCRNLLGLHCWCKTLVNYQMLISDFKTRLRMRQRWGFYPFCVKHPKNIIIWNDCNRIDNFHSFYQAFGTSSLFRVCLPKWSTSPLPHDRRCEIIRFALMDGTQKYNKYGYSCFLRSVIHVFMHPRGPIMIHYHREEVCQPLIRPFRSESEKWSGWLVYDWKER